MAKFTSPIFMYKYHVYKNIDNNNIRKLGYEINMAYWK